MVDVDKARSMAASMQRKRYMGSCRLRSVLTMKTTMQFPNNATTYIERRGKPNQKWASSSPGIPISTKVACVKFQELIACTEEGEL
jgi:hypothetical protein